MKDLIINADELKQSGTSEEAFVFPASYAQQRLWFLDQFEPGSPYYNIPSALRIKGPFNISLLKRVIDELAVRHESLRTNFSTIDGKPVQVISQNVNIPFVLIDLSDLNEENKERNILTLATEASRYSFNISSDPLFRVTILKLNDDDHALIVVMHHIISDGWSMSILVEEITKLYAAFSQGRPSPLEELVIQYADYSLWQKEYLEGDVLNKQLDYWKNKMGNNPPFLELPTDRPRPSIWTNNGSSVSITISKEILNKILLLGRKENATLFMTLMAVFNILLYKYSNQDDISIGTPIANRTRKEVEKIIGLFINTIVIRSDLSGNPSFREFLQKVRKTTLEAYENQDLPFELLVEKLQPDRDMSYQPLFQVMFILQNLPVNSQELAGLSISMIDVDMGTSTSDITLTASETFEGLNISAEYNTDLFDKKTIEQLLLYYSNLLNNILADPDTPINSLPLIGKEEINKIIYEWNKTDEAAYKRIPCINRLFEKQAELSPESTAVVFKDESITYKDLNERANQMARMLQRMGVGPEVVVGICVERSIEMMICVLAVVKAGGAYLPLDTSYPVDRLSYMLEDSESKVLITESKLLKILPQFSGCILFADKDTDEILHEEVSNLNNQIDENNIVYLIYTSGSTGRPKGTMITHQSLVNAYLAWESSYRLRSFSGSHLQMANFSFDVFTGDWTRCLCSGGKLVLTPREMLLEAESLYKLMQKEEVTTAEFVPAVLRNLVQYLDSSGNKLDFLNLLIAGSDIWYVGEYKKFLNYCGKKTRLINSYGLTEATIDSCFFEGNKIEIPDEHLVPIGRPFANTGLFVLDRFYQPLPVGLIGELFVGGKGLSRGYLKRPELTAEKFIPNPFGLTPGERLYRTGDSARYLPDGNIEFLGRRDTQVKLRGFRVELGEIETAISRYENVKDAAVILREDVPGDKRIAAYIVTKNGNDIAPSELKQFISDQLPEYMIPNAFIFLKKLPLSPNGKVDRRSLPAPDMEEVTREIKTNFVAPHTGTEEIIAAIWSEILKIDRIGIYDDFFDLGGHSLLATQVVSRIRNAFDIDLPLRYIFESPTVSGLAQIVELENKGKAGLQGAEILPVPPGEEIPLSFAQKRLWFLDQLEPESAFYNMPETFRLRGRLDTGILEKSINEVIKRHQILRSSFPTINGKAVTVISPQLEIKIPLIDLSNYKSEEQDKLIENIADNEIRKYIPLDNAPLFRILIIRLSEEEHVFIGVFHHILTDEWSSKVMLGEIAEIYDSLVNNKNVSLPELRLQYSDYAYWQRKFLSGENLDKQLNYWKNKLDGIPQLLDLPLNRPRPAVQSFKGDYLSFEIDPSTTSDLLKFNKKHGSTLFMFLLSVLQVLLNRICHQDDILIGTPVANRNRADIESLIGFFVNTLVLRCKVERGMKFIGLLDQTRQNAIESYTYQDLPFEMLVDALHPERDLSHSPLFQVMFVIQNASPGEQKTKSGLSLLPVDVHSRTSKFDLTFFAVEELDRIGFAIEYNSDLFDPSAVNAFFSFYKLILKQVLEDPEIEISRIALLGPSEEELLIQKINNPVTIPVLDKPVFRLFENQAKLNPEKIAARLKENGISCAELNKNANKLAHYLIRRGVTADTAVGLAVGRSIELLISLIGILKSGGCYVPLDVSYPKERLSYIAEDSNMFLLITDKNSSRTADFENASFIKSSSIIHIDEQWPEIDKELDSNTEIILDADNLAYIIYTSGSTGKPKGTMITHGNLMNYLSWTLAAYPYGETEETLFHSTIAFDATVTSIYPALLSGGTVRIIPEERDVFLLGEELKKDRSVSIVKITPAHLDILSQQFSEEKDLRLKAFVVGGENLSKKQIRFYQQRFPEILIYNEYGPTEATVGCIVYDGSHFEGMGSVPIGKVIPGVQVYILDENLKPVPENISGELYIGGKGLSRGYLKRPELTAEKFIPDPFGNDQAGGRLYKTGDLVKLLYDGNIEFLGRVDEQVKIHGYRVELGEVETLLKMHPLLQDAIVIKSKKQGDEKLAAYCVPETAIMPSSGELRNYLGDKLPAYMIPSVYVFVDSYPLTPNGKIDYKALPEAKVERSVLSEEYVSPESPSEMILLHIWQEVLNVEKIGINDNFFELGGDSIISIQVVARANQAGIKLSPKDIFQNPTIKSLASISANNITIKAEQGIVKGEFPLTPVQQWLFDQQLNDINHYNQSMLFEIMEELDLKSVESALSEVIKHHDALRTVFVKKENKWQQFIRSVEESSLRLINNKASAEEGTVKFDNPKGEIPLIHLDMSGIPDEDLSPQVEKLSSGYQASLDIENELMKIVYFDSGKSRKHWMLIIIHHLIIDVISWRILMEDFQAAYKKLMLPLKTTSVKDWAERLKKYAQSEDILKEFDYWKRLSGEDIPQIISDSVYISNYENEASSLQVSLDEESTNMLLREIPKVLHTEIIHTLLSALTRAITKTTGKARLLVSLEGHGREAIFDDLDVSHTIGWYTTIYPVLLDLEGTYGIKDSVYKIKDQLLQIPNRGIGFGILRYLTEDERIKLVMSRIPEPQISFNYLGQFGGSSNEASAIVPAKENKGPERGPLNSRPFLIEITSEIINGKFSSEWTFSSKIFSAEKIQKMADDFIKEILAIIDFVNTQSTDFSAKDFTDFGWEQSDIDKILTAINVTKE